MGESFHNLCQFSARVILLYALQDGFGEIASAQATPPHIEAYAKRSQAERPLGLALAERRVSTSRVALQQTKRESYASPQEKLEAVQECQQSLVTHEAELARLTDPLEPYFASIDEKGLKIGDIGRLEWSEAIVFQVIDDDNMLVEFEWPVRALKSHDLTSAPTRENVSETTEFRTKLVWVRGIDTSQQVSGKEVMYQNVGNQSVFYIRRSQNYATQRGSESVLLLEAVDMKPWTKLFDQSGNTRTWRDGSGKHSIEAAFADYKGGNVRLVDIDGKSRTLKLKELSKVDQAYVRAQLSLRRKALSELTKNL